MNRSIKTLAAACFAAITLFSCASLSAQTDALIVQPEGKVGLGLDTSQLAQTREHILLARQVGIAQNLLLFSQPTAPIFLQWLGVDADANGIVDKDDFTLWQSSILARDSDQWHGFLSDVAIWPRR